MFGPEFFEMLMMLSFGFAWPTSIIKSLKTRSAKGKSIVFMTVIWSGYLFGIIAKFAASSLTYVLVFYIINICMVSIDIILFFINKRRDRQQELLEEGR
jgi:hypothetical protein